MDKKKPKTGQKRQFIGMHFTCCNVYTRLYINKAKTAFVGWCPKCTRKAEVKISPTGSNTRMFQAD